MTIKGLAAGGASNEAVGGSRAFITGLAGLTLSEPEANFLAETRPCGLIIFSRNFQDDDQLRALISAARDAVGGGALLVLVDQEGGRVQRLRGGDWPDVPPAARFGDLYRRDPARSVAALRSVMHGLGVRLRGVGINCDCLPCLDVPVAGADNIIGDRAFSNDPEVVAVLGRAAAEGLMDAGVLPVIKHIPGHGRALVDSHKSLPVVRAGAEALRQQDFRPFAALSDMPAAMSAHVTFEAFDSEQPASISPIVMQAVVRGEIGFDGLVMSDDISMGALAGSLDARARAVLAAGSDVVLHCNGNLDDMREVARNTEVLAGAAMARYERCLNLVKRPAETMDEAEFDAALALAHSASEAGGSHV